jgi:glycosyltransferase involved in cell wall biosynthesis
MGGAGPLDVALLSPCFWPEVRRGGERFVRDLADGLLARGHHPRLITSHPGLPRRTVEDGLHVLRLPRPPHGPLLRRMYEPYVTHVPLSYMALRAASADVAHAVYPTDALAAGRWRRATGRPAVLSYLGIPTRLWLDERHRRGVMARALRDCDAVVALSDHAADGFAREFGYTAPVIHPGVNLEAFRPSGARAQRPTIICSAAVSEPRKHVALLVEALQHVRRHHEDAELVLSRPRTTQDVERVGIDPHAPGVVWADLDDTRVLARMNGEAWAAVLPSVDEAFGLVLVEALACGTPVVGYDGGALPEVINTPAIGRLFAELTAESLATAVLEAFDLSRLPETSARCRDRAEQFSVDRCVDGYVDLYRQLGA